MKKMFKRALSLVMALVIVLGVVPIGASAQESGEVDSLGEDYSISSTTAFGDVIVRAMEESGDGADTDGYSISEVQLNGNTAEVQFSNIAACKLAVVIYSEEGQMLGFGIEDVEVSANEATVSIDIATVPEYYVLKAFLLDDNMAALCKAYYDIEHTKEFEKFDRKTVSDFEDNIVLNFDEAEDNNFAVLKDGAHEIAASDTYNILQSSDEETGTYVFVKINSEIESLKAGDTFCYGEGENILLIKVASVSISGDMAVIVEDKEAGIDDLFEYVKVDLASNETGDDKTVDMTGVEEGITLIGYEPYKEEAPQVMSARSGTQTRAVIDKDYKNTIKCPVWKLDEEIRVSGDTTVKVEGKIKTSFEYRFKVYYDTDWNWRLDFWNSLSDYFFFQVTFKTATTGEISLSGEIEKPIFLGTVDFATPVGIVCSIGFRLIIKASVSCELTIGELSATVGFRYDEDTGFKNLSSGPKLELFPELKGKAEASIGIRMSPSISLVKVAGFSLSPEFGAKASADVFSFEKDPDEKHMCSDCLTGDVSLYFKAELTGDIFGKKFAKKKLCNEVSWKLFDFYISLDNGVDFNVGRCPKIAYKVSFVVKDSNGNKLKNAVVSSGANNYIASAANAGKLEVKTDSSGEAEYFYPAGNYTAKVTLDGYKDATVNVKVAAQTKSYTVTMGTNSSSSGETGGDSETYIVSGTCGDKLTWTFDESNGTLTISGKGNMDNFKTYDSPWANYKDVIKTIVIKDGVTSIGIYAFFNCDSLTSITIPDSVISIGESAFYDCDGLTSITIPDSVTSISSYTFKYCNKLTSITIPDSVTSIGERAFYDCKGLTSITIPDSVTSIGESAFYHCDGLTSITIPGSVTSIGVHAFHSCDSLTSIVVEADNENYSSFDDALFDKHKIKLIRYPIGNTRTSYTIPDSVTSIGVDAFTGCYRLTSITIPDSVISIGDNAFHDCDGLTSITIPDSVTSIGDSVFCYSDRLTSIVVEADNENYSSFDDVLFDKHKIKLIRYPIGNTRTSYTIPDSVTSIGDHAFCHCGGLTSITIPDSVTSIGESAFAYCNDLTSITIPDSVTSIGERAFEGCHSLTSITIPDSVMRIGNYAFAYCDGLTSITIPGNMTSIGDNAFFDCDGLTSITIPDSVTRIYPEAFDYCTSLTDVYYGGTEEQWKKILIDYRNEPLKNATIHYNCTDAYALSSRTVAEPIVYSANKASDIVVSRGKVVCSGAQAGELYMVYAYVGDLDFKYIDQSTADENGTVTFAYYPMDYSGDITVKVVGVFDGTVQEKTFTPQMQEASNMVLEEETLAMNRGDKYQLVPVFTPSHTTDQSVKWTTSDKKIATVDENGFVTAKKEGRVTITATATNTDGSSFVDSVEITVTGKSFWDILLEIILAPINFIISLFG